MAPNVLTWKDMKHWIEVFMPEYRRRNIPETLWQAPLSGVACASNPLFERLKEVVGKNHALPSDWLDDAASVVCYFVPFSPELGNQNVSGRYCSRSWGAAYVETNKLIADLGTFLCDKLESAGFHAQATQVTHNFDEELLISNWSQKHVAFVAGLGTFGSNHLLITEKGCCGRLGSLVTNASFPPTDRPDGEFCLRRVGRTCVACVVRCPVGALKENEYDRHVCYALCQENADRLSDLGLADVCGKCGTLVPCAHVNPTANV